MSLQAGTAYARTGVPERSHYLKEIRQLPMLEAQQEYLLAKSWCERGDQDAADRLATSHLRLVAKLARGYRGHGLPLSELISEGNIGLIYAIKRFEPERRPASNLCNLVDQGRDAGIHLAFMVPGEDGHDYQPEEAVLRTPVGQSLHRGPGGGGPSA